MAGKNQAALAVCAQTKFIFPFKCCMAALKVSPYFIMVQIIFSAPLESTSSCLFVLNKQIVFNVSLWKYSIQSLKTADCVRLESVHER